MSNRYVEGGEDRISTSNETGNLLAFGLQMIDKIKWWYSRLNSQYYYKRESTDLPTADLSQVEHINNKLADILKVQSQKRGIYSNDEDKSLKIVVKEQEERILQLEGEKSLLIRELFQLKAQLKSPASKGNFPLFN